MNKLIIDKEYIKLDNCKYDIEIKKRNCTIEIDNEVYLNDIKTMEDINIKVVLNDNAKLVFNRYSRDTANINIEFIINNNTSLEFNQSNYTNLESKYDCIINILGSNNKSIVNIYSATNNKGSIVVNANGIVNKNIKNNELLENVRILSLNNAKNIILPNLLVSSNVVEVNHNATISGIDKNYLFPL